MSAQWGVTDASEWELAGEEPEGLRQHRWLRHPDQERTWLFKQREVFENRPFHEDLTEKLASEIARAIGVPVARVELAQRHGKRGCLVEDVRWSGGGLQPGAVLLSAVVERYDVDDKGHRGHSVANIHRGLVPFGPPPVASVPTSFAAFDVFVGYLILDALIANTDRHEQNWAVLTRPPGQAGPDALCASYDHASSLGL